MPGFKVSPLPAPPTFAASEVPEFGRVVEGFHPGKASPEDFKEIEDLLYEHSILVFRGLHDLEPEAQLRLTQHFDPSATSYGHGNNKTGSEKKSILHPDLKTLPEHPQVQLIGNGVRKSAFFHYQACSITLACHSSGLCDLADVLYLDAVFLPQ